MCTAQFVLSLALVCLTSTIGEAPAGGPSNPDTTVAIESPPAAYSRAADYIGTPKTGPMASQAVKEAKVITITDDETPFLRHRINGSRAWRLTICNVSLAKDPKYAADSSTWRDLDVYIDSTNGELLKVVCNYQPLLPNEVGEMSPEYAEEQLRGGGDLRAVIPPDPPEIGFVSAAKGCPHDVLLAKEIVAVYINYPYGKQDLRPVWMITTRGIPPLAVRGLRGLDLNKIPLYQRNHVCQMVDARTGVCFTAANAPQYKLKDEDNPFKHVSDSTKSPKQESPKKE